MNTSLRRQAVIKLVKNSGLGDDNLGHMNMTPWRHLIIELLF